MYSATRLFLYQIRLHAIFFHLLNSAFLSSAKYPVPVSGNDIIEEVADKGRNYDKSIK